jgi:hyperosmotically inducible periplasmic protein
MAACLGNIEVISMNKSFPKLAWSTLGVALLLLSACNKPPEVGSAIQPSTTTAANVLDLDVSLNVKMALMNDPILNTFEIEVITSNGDVRLIGLLDSQDQIDSAIKLAKQAEGTLAIHNELTIK